MNNSEDYHKNKIRLCFNRAAATYDECSHPQQMIGSKLIDLVGKYASNVKSVIDLGCGSGIVTEQLALRLRYQEFVGIDISDSLIELATSRLHKQKIQTLTQDFENFNFKQYFFNLAFSNMSLHWSRALQRNLLHINGAMATDGMIAFTVPLEGTFSELNSTSRNSFYRLEEVRNNVADAGFELIESFEETLIFNYESKMKALKTIKATGANYLFNRDRKSLASKKSLTDLHVQTNLSYNIGYFIGRKIKCPLNFL